MPSQLGNCPPQAPRQSAASGFAEFNLQLGLLAGWGTGPKGAFCSRLVAIVVPDVHVPHGRLNNNGALVAVKTLRAVTNAFGPPAKWLSRSRATPLSGQWPLVGDKGVIVAGGPQNISGDIRRDDGELLVVAATDRGSNGGTFSRNDSIETESAIHAP